MIDWVSWAGHCDIKGSLESTGLVLPQGHEGVQVYNSTSGKTVAYPRRLVHEYLLSFGEMDSQMKRPSVGARPSVDLGETNFAGARDDDLPDRLTLGDIRIPSQDRPNEFTVTKVVVGAESHDAGKLFNEYIADADGLTAKKNPFYRDTEQGDRIRVNLANTAIHATAKFQSFDDQSGYPSTVTKEIVLDFDKPSAKPVMIDSVMQDANKRELYEISVNTETKEWIAQLVRMEKKAGGRGYEKKEIGQPIVKKFDPSKIIASHETNLDNPSLYFDFIKEALLTGKNFVSETADGASVWNGCTKRLKEAVVTRDDKKGWAKIELEVDARYGGGSGEFLVKLTKDGKPEFFVPISFAFDFAWQSKIAFAPKKDGLVNATAFDRKIVTKEGATIHSDALDNVIELLHCAFKNQNYLIRHEGQTYYFDTKAQWEAEKAKLDALRTAVYVDQGGPAPELGIGVLLEKKDKLAKKAVQQFEVVAEGDGPIKIRVETEKGDADLFVKKGGAATAEDHTLKSENTDLKADEITIDAKKGEKIGIAVLGYKSSDFTLSVTGPKEGAQPVADAAFEFTTKATLVRNGEKRFHFDATADGELKVKLQGSGNANVYLRVGDRANTREFDTKLDGPTSNEQGTIKVKKGDRVYGLMRGLATKSEVDLSIRS